MTAPPGPPMHLTVVHVTEYRYPEPAWDSFNEVRLSPTDDQGQSLLSFELDVSPEATARSHLDYYGNRTHQFHIAEAHRRLAIEARSSVVTYPRPAPMQVAADSLAELRPRFFEFLAPTRRVPLDHDWATAMQAPALAADGDLVEYLSGLIRHLHDFFTYRPNVTEIDTPMADFVRARAGVCQDYTHAMLALCRRVGIPARYVSGYLETGAGLTLGSDASHAWIEAYLPGSGWVGFDPTNGTVVGQTYVKVGHGRDYDDVPPVKGLRRGGGTESLRVAVRVLRAATPDSGTAAASTS
jgi:transglutaminase-like putative cysteine protease